MADLDLAACLAGIETLRTTITGHIHGLMFLLALPLSDAAKEPLRQLLNEYSDWDQIAAKIRAGEVELQNRGFPTLPSATLTPDILAQVDTALKEAEETRGILHGEAVAASVNVLFGEPEAKA